MILNAQDNETENIGVDSLPVMGVMAPQKKTNKKDALEDPIAFSAKDSIDNNLKLGLISLYNDAKVNYQTIELRAGFIKINKNQDLVFAKGIIDTSGRYIQRPILKENGKIYYTDSLYFNIKTKQAVTFNVKTKEAEGYVIGDMFKKENDSILLIKRFKFTGDNKKKPDYYIYSDKVKLVKNEWVIASFSQMYIADIPTLFMLPFGFFQMGSEGKSGVIFPTYGESPGRGFFLQNLGYYVPIGDYIGVKGIMDVYSRGGYGVRTNIQYKKRYKYSGNLNYNFESFTQGEFGRDDYSKSQIYSLIWNQSVDRKSSPYSSFSASVSFTSSSYFRQSIQYSGSSQQLNPQTSSSVSYSKNWPNSPFSMSSNIRVSQNFQTRQADFTLPSVNFSMTRIFPFDDGKKDTWWKNINFSYNTTAQNRATSIPDTLIFSNYFLENMQNGIKHSLPLSTNFKLFEYLNVSPNITYNEIWSFKKLNQHWDNNTNTLVKDTLSEFGATRTFSTGVSLSTQVYGFVDFGKKSYINAVRHVLSPRISYSFSPNFKDDIFGYYDTYQTGDIYGTTNRYSPYMLSLYGYPRGGLSNSINMSLSNNFEAKIRNNNPDEKPTKVKLLDFINLSSGYNITAPSFQWRDVSMSTATSFFNGRLNVAYNTSFDWYASDNSGKRVEEFYFNTKRDGWLWWRQKQYSLSSGFSVSDTDFYDGGGSKKDRTKGKDDNSSNDFDYIKNTGGNNDVRNNPFETEESRNNSDMQNALFKRSEYYGAKGSWKINFSYSFSKTLKSDGSSNDVQSLSFSGNWNLTDKWHIGYGSGWDFKANNLSYTSFNVSRDLDSWNLTFNWIPLGTYTSYSFFIGIKSSILKDVKYDKRSNPSDFND